MYACYNSLRSTIKRRMKGSDPPDKSLVALPQIPVQLPASAIPVNFQCHDDWGWNPYHKSEEVRIYGANRETAHFHPNWSNGTAGVRGERILNSKPSARFYWEIKIADRIFGTSMMFGIGTKKGRLHAECFLNMIGEDENGWALSHKGLLWHNNHWVQYTKPFPENKPTTIGLLFDAAQGTLTYFKDGHCLGVAFTGLETISQNLYPMVCSTAAKTEVTLVNMRRDFSDLQDRCRHVITRSVAGLQDVSLLGLPRTLESFVADQRDIRDCDHEDEEPSPSKTSRSETLSPYSQKHPHVSRAIAAVSSTLPETISRYPSYEYVSHT